MLIQCFVEFSSSKGGSRCDGIPNELRMISAPSNSNTRCATTVGDDYSARRPLRWIVTMFRRDAAASLEWTFCDAG